MLALFKEDGTIVVINMNFVTSADTFEVADKFGINICYLNNGYTIFSFSNKTERDEQFRKIMNY